MCRRRRRGRRRRRAGRRARRTRARRRRAVALRRRVGSGMRAAMAAAAHALTAQPCARAREADEVDAVALRRRGRRVRRCSVCSRVTTTAGAPRSPALEVDRDDVPAGAGLVAREARVDAGRCSASGAQLAGERPGASAGERALLASAAVRQSQLIQLRRERPRRAAPRRCARVGRDGRARWPRPGAAPRRRGVPSARRRVAGRLRTGPGSRRSRARALARAPAARSGAGHEPGAPAGAHRAGRAPR